MNRASHPMTAIAWEEIIPDAFHLQEGESILGHEFSFDPPF